MLLDDARLAATPPALIRMATRAVLELWDREDPAASTPFLDTGYRGAWPPRVGYYVGLLAARQLGQNTSLQAMAGWDRGVLSKQLRPIVEALSRS